MILVMCFYVMVLDKLIPFHIICLVDAVLYNIFSLNISSIYIINKLMYWILVSINFGCFGVKFVVSIDSIVASWGLFYLKTLGTSAEWAGNVSVTPWLPMSVNIVMRVWWLIVLASIDDSVWVPWFANLPRVQSTSIHNHTDLFWDKGRPGEFTILIAFWIDVNYFWSH